MALKILFVNSSDSVGGAARAAYRIHKSIQQFGCYSRMLVLTKTRADNDIIKVSDFDNSNIIKNCLRWSIHKINNKLQQARWRPYSIDENVFLSDLRSTSIHGAFQKIDFDVLHLHWINLRFLNLKELKKTKKSIVWTLHDCWAFSGICHYFYDCERYTLSCGNCPFLHSDNENDLSHRIWKNKQEFYKGLNMHIVTPSNWLAKAARQSSLLKDFPVSVIPNPIDTELYSPGDREEACKCFSLPTDKKYILYSAMNALKDKNKGFIYLVEALNKMDLTELKDTELLILGANQPIQELILSIPVRYLGIIQSDKTIVQAYSAAEIMIVPSLSENLSNVVMESLSCGTPVVAFDIGGNSDMVDHKQNGYLAEAKEPQDLAIGIAWCLENNTSGELSRNAREKVEENYSLKQVGEKYSELYKSLIQ